MSEVENNVDVKKIEKRGRTLIVNNTQLNKLNYDGLTSSFQTNSGFTFLTFKDIITSKEAYLNLIENKEKVKYSYYKLFIRFNPSKYKDDLNEAKESLKKNILQNIDTDYLFIKIYTKNKSLIGSGEIILDTKKSLDDLIKLKSIVIDNSNTLNFYKFKVNKNLNETKLSTE